MPVNFFRNFTFLIAIVLSVSSSVFADDETETPDRCKPIIAEALLTNKVEQSDSSKRAAERYYLCSASYRDIRNYLNRAQSNANQSGGGINIFEYLGFDAQADNANAGNLTTNDINVWKSSNCTEKSSSINEAAAAYSFYRTLSPQQIDAWKTCILATGPQAATSLRCVAEPTETEIVFEAHWKSAEGSTPTIDSMFVSRSGVREQIENRGNLLVGKNVFVVTRQYSADHRIVLNAHNGANSVSCSLLIPKIPPPVLSVATLSSLNGKWCDVENPSYNFEILADGNYVSQTDQMYEPPPNVQIQNYTPPTNSQKSWSRKRIYNAGRGIIAVEPENLYRDDLFGVIFWKRSDDELRQWYIIVTGDQARDMEGREAGNVLDKPPKWRLKRC